MIALAISLSEGVRVPFRCVPCTVVRCTIAVERERASETESESDYIII